MQNRVSHFLQRHGVWLALLGHLLFLFNLSWLWLFPVKPSEKGPELNINSYVYHEQSQAAPATSAQKTKPPDKNGMEKRTPDINTASAASNEPNRPDVVKISKDDNPVHLIGDKNVKKPLLVLLGKALSAHLAYPKIAVDFDVRGIVLVGFTVYPDGHVTNAQIVKSSSAAVLDKAALTAVNAMSPVPNVNVYLNEPKYLVVGIIFG